MFKVLGRPKIAALKLHLDIYKYYLANKGNVPHWRIFQIFDLYSANNSEYYSIAIPAYIDKLTMTNTVSRHLRLARNLIENTGKGRFPDFKKY